MPGLRPTLVNIAVALVAGCLATTCLATTVFAESPTLTKIKQRGIITLGYREASIPFSYLGAEQKPIGFSLDLCAIIVDKVKSDLKLDTLKVDLQPVSGSNRIPLIQNGTVDIECGGTSSSVARLKQVSFTVATFVSSARWLTKKADDIKDVKGLDGKTIVVTQGSNAAGFAFGLKGKGSTFNVIQGKDHAESMLLLQTNRAAAFMEDDILLASLKAKEPDPAAFTFLPETYELVPYGLMLPKDDPEFKAVADGVLKSMMASGDFLTLYKKMVRIADPVEGREPEVPAERRSRRAHRPPQRQRSILRVLLVEATTWRRRGMSSFLGIFPKRFRTLS